MKKFLSYIVGLSMLSLLTIGSVAFAFSYGYQGGTGYSTTTASNVGKFLQVASTSPLLTYVFANASGSGGGSTTNVFAVFPINSTQSGTNATLTWQGITTSSAPSANNFPFYTAASGTLSGTSTLTTSGGNVTQNGNFSVTSGVANFNGMTNAGTATTTNITVTSVTSSLGLFGSNGVLSEYGGASACSAGQAVTTISATGGTTCSAFLTGTKVDSANSITGALIIAGTLHQVNVASSSQTITLSTPQNIDTTSTPTFSGVQVNGISTLASTTFTGNVTGTSLNLSGAESIGGNLTFSNDNTNNIGAIGATRPASLFAGTGVNSSGTLNVAGISSLASTTVNGSLSVGTSSAPNASTTFQVWSALNATTTVFIGATSTVTSTYRTGCIAMAPSQASGTSFIYWDFSAAGALQTSTTACP